MPATTRYDELPVIADLGVRQAWEVFGAGDELGTLNRLTREVVLSAAATIRTGERFGLNLELQEPDPTLAGRPRFEHEVFALDRNTWDDKIAGLAPQGSTQWDGFRHVRCREYGFYGGVTDDPIAGHPRLGIQHWSRQGIVGRGVLLDVARHLQRQGDYDAFDRRSISPELLLEVAEQQNSPLEVGDIVCIRFGWLQAYRQLTRDQRVELARRTAFQFAGLAPDESMARLLWDLGISALACDNPGVEVAPFDAARGTSLHRRLLAGLGIPLGELFDFDLLASACSADERYAFFFSAVPLPIVGGVGSPANAVAIR